MVYGTIFFNKYLKTLMARNDSTIYYPVTTADKHIFIVRVYEDKANMHLCRIKSRPTSFDHPKFDQSFNVGIYEIFRVFHPLPPPPSLFLKTKKNILNRNSISTKYFLINFECVIKYKHNLFLLYF